MSMSNHEQIIMAMTVAEITTPVEQTPTEHLHDGHDHNHDHSSEHAAEPAKLTIREKLGNWAISKSGIMQNQHVENITAATCCGAVCRADLPVVAAYIATTAVASVHKPKSEE